MKTRYFPAHRIDSIAESIPCKTLLICDNKKYRYASDYTSDTDELKHKTICLFIIDRKTFYVFHTKKLYSYFPFTIYLKDSFKLIYENGDVEKINVTTDYTLTYRMET